MRLIAQQYLNARTGRPSTDAPIPYYVEPGTVLLMDDVVTGQELEGNCIWYHNAEDGCYYWSGAINEPEQTFDKMFAGIEELNIYSSAVNELAGKYKFIPGYKGMAAGFKEVDSQLHTAIALIFYVDRKLPETEGMVPAFIIFKGIRLLTDVRETGEASLLLGNTADQSTPYAMGGSISEDVLGTDTSFGTRTLIVTKFKVDYLLTCFHVACNSLFEKKQYFVGSNTVHVVLPSTGAVPVGKRQFRLRVAEGGFDTAFDYALLELGDARLINSMPDFQFSGFYTRSELRQRFSTNMRVAKYGARTLASENRLIAYHSDAVEVSTARKLKMSGLVEARKMSDKGDSGAPVIDVSNDKLIGFIIADNASSTYILPFGELLARLSIEPKL